MSWTEFLKILGLLYAVYYVIVIAIDNFHAGADKTTKEQTLVLSFAEENPEIISDIPQREEPAEDRFYATPPAPRNWEDDLPEQDPREDYEEDQDGRQDDPHSTELQEHEQDAQTWDPDDKQPATARPSPLASGITDFSGGVSLEDLLQHLRGEKIDTIEKLYAKDTDHEIQQAPTASSAT